MLPIILRLIITLLRLPVSSTYAGAGSDISGLCNTGKSTQSGTNTRYEISLTRSAKAPTTAPNINKKKDQSFKTLTKDETDQASIVNIETKPRVGKYNKLAPRIRKHWSGCYLQTSEMSIRM